MRKLLHSLILPFALISQTTTMLATEEEEEENAKHPAMKVLPVGSSLHDLRIPRFNKDYETTSVLTAKKMDILSKHKMKGTHVDITLYKDNSPQVRTHLDSAFYTENKGIIHSMENILISGDTFDIAAQGLILKWGNRAGFLLGKTQTLFYSDIDKKMTSPVSKPKNKKSLPTAPVILKAKSLAAAAVAIPTLLSTEELEELDTLAAPSTQLIQAVDAETQDNLQDIQQTAQQVSNAKETLQAQLVNAVNTDVTPTSQAKKIVPQANKIPVTVNCADGMYFDALSGTLVYQNDITVTHPQYKLTCTDELKILLKEDTTTSETSPKENKNNSTITPDTKNLTKFSGIKKAIATDNVVINAKDKDGKLITAKSEMASYDGITGIMILRGGKPTIQQGDTIIRILSDNGYIKILPNMSVRIEGRHEIKANLNELQNNKQQ